MSYLWLSLEESYPSVEKQSVYCTVPAHGQIIYRVWIYYSRFYDRNVFKIKKKGNANDQEWRQAFTIKYGYYFYTITRAVYPALISHYQEE